MNRYKAVVMYAGKNYAGWQSQKNGNTIQEILEDALHALTGTVVYVQGSGRTDAGVNARAQVFHFDTEKEMAERKWISAINAYLPEDIHITDVKKVTSRFHARHCVRWKKYAYRVYSGGYDVFTRDTAYQCPVELDFEKMKDAAQVYLGTHDFTSLNSSPLSEYPDQIRTIFAIDMKKEGNLITMTFQGKGFLRYMVRMMAAQLIEIGKGKMTKEDLISLMEKKQKNLSKRNAPACGLTLEEVDYFEIAATNEYGMIREYLYSDELKEGMALEDAECAVRERVFPIPMIFTERRSERKCGEVMVYGDHTEILLEREEDRKAAESLMPYYEAWCKDNNILFQTEIRRKS